MTTLVPKEATKRTRRTAPPRVVVVTRATEYEWLLSRHATAEQARFFLASRGQSLEVVQAQHERFDGLLTDVLGAIPADWRRATVRRKDLDRFLFEPRDIVVAMGQDGLVANVAKYLDGQSVIGLNPDPDRFEGILVPHRPEAAADLLHDAAADRVRHQARTMVEARLDDGQSLVALNEVFVGHRTHQSARYEISFGTSEEVHSSSGLIIATGTGATGWARSIATSRACALPMPQPEDECLVFFAREAWPSVATGTTLVEGLVDEEHTLEITSRMESDGVIFGDGIEADRVEFGWGRRLVLRPAAKRLMLVA